MTKTSELSKEPEIDFKIDTLGAAKIESPIKLSSVYGDSIANYEADYQYIMYDISVMPGMSSKPIKKGQLLQRAGPRERIYFDSAKAHAGIVTCGGLCPGLNDVIRAIVMGLWNRYGVRSITGIRNGYKGFLPEYKFPVMDLCPDSVKFIHKMGGTVLGSCRGGGERTEDIVDAIERMNLQMLFVIGGDGSQKGALKIAEEIEKRGLKIAIVGVPKTIDNDLAYIQRSFGFQTAVAKACEAVDSAKIEALGAHNGVGLVKVMGRHSGFIAAYTALATNEADVVLIPEVAFKLEGENGLFNYLEKVLDIKKRAVILVAEGAGEELVGDTEEVDASGNKKLADVGVFLKDKLKGHFKKIDKEISLKYIDPSYIIRSTPANPNDSIYCARLGYSAVHAAMAGKTKMVVSLINNKYVHVPIKMTVSHKKRVHPESSLWRDVVEDTGQPIVMV
jgi:6-phosphofructokinase 1